MSNVLYVPHIDGLRALAVSVVMLYHLNSAWMPAGFVGVDIFFVISGYVVSTSLIQATPESFQKFALHFYVRRILRIAPALLLCLLVTSLVATLFIPRAWLSESNEYTALAAFFGFSNVLLAMKQDSYYSPRAEFNPFIHTWSLGVEEQFYLIFPPLAYLWLRAAAHHRRLVLSVLLALGMASLVFSWWLGAHGATNAAFYSVFSRFWELGTGVLLSVLTLNTKQPLALVPFVVRVLLQLLALGLIAISVIYANLAAFPFPWALVPVLASALLIVSLKGEARCSPVLALFSNPVVVGMGRLSYSLYLWHWPVFVLLRWTAGLDTLGTQLGGLLLTGVLASASFFLLEHPIRTAPSLRRLHGWVVLLGGLGCVAASALLAYLIFAHQDKVSLSVTRDTAAWYPGHYQPVTDASHCPVIADSAPMAGGSRTRYGSNGCGKNAQAGRLFVLGDSHAAAYTDLFVQLTNNFGNNVVLYAKGGCSYLNLFQPDSLNASDCQEFARSSVRDILDTAQPGDILFLPSLRVRRLGDNGVYFRKRMSCCR